MVKGKYDVEISVGVIGNIKKQLAIAQKELVKASKSGTNFSASLDKANAIKSRLSGITNALSPIKKGFDGAALSVMFFGMAMKRVFDSMWKFGKTTFQDIQHSVEGAVTSFDDLDASVKLLGYSLGAALAPVAEWLAPIIWGIASTVMESESLQAIIRAVAVALAVVGSLLMTYGILKLGVGGTVEVFGRLFSLLRLIAGLKMWGQLWTWIKGWKIFGSTTAASATGLMANVAAIVIMAAAVLAIIVLLKSLSGVWGNVWKGWSLKLQLLNNLWQRLELQMEKGALNITKSLELAGLKFQLAMTNAWNAVKAGFASSINWVVDKVQKLIDAINRRMGRYSPFKGLSVSNFKISASITDTSGLKSDIASIETEWVNAYDAITKAQWELLKQTSAIEEQMAQVETEGFAQWKQNFVDMFDELKNTLGIDANTLVSKPGETGGNITYIDQITVDAPQQPGESQADWVARIREEYEARIAK